MAELRRSLFAGAIRHAVDAFRANPHAAVVYGEGYQIDEFGGIKSRFPYTQHHDLWKLTNVSDYILQQTAFFRKAALDAVGPIREDLHYVMDWEIFIRLGKRFDFVFVPEYMGSLREYDAAKTSAGGGGASAKSARCSLNRPDRVLPPGLVVYGLASYKRDLAATVDKLPQPLYLAGRAWRRCANIVADATDSPCQHPRAGVASRWLGGARGSSHVARGRGPRANSWPNPGRCSGLE